MHDRPSRGRIAAKRLLLLTASLAVGAVGWFLLGEFESLTAQETPRAETPRAATPPETVLARVDGVAITEAEVRGRVAEELLRLERQRRELISRTVRSEVERRLIAAEADRRGISEEELLAAEDFDDLTARLAASHEIEYLLEPLPLETEAPAPR